MTTTRKGGFLSAPRGVVMIIFALMLIGLYGMLTSNVGIPMLEWAQGAIPSQIESLLNAIGC
jgi:hypothetical protein